MDISEVESSSSTFNTFVLKPYLPVIIVDLVGVQVGFDHKLLNVIPDFDKV